MQDILKKALSLGLGALLVSKDKIEDVVNEICSMMVGNDSPPNIIAKFNDACRIIRQNRMLCDVHKQLDPSIDVAGCHVCDGTEESEWKPISLKQ